jgi:hypothetical protein
MVYVEHKRRNGVDECRTVAERRTAAHHIETGAKMSWPGVALDECARWMLGQLPVGVPHGDAPNPATSSAGPAPAQAGSVPHSFDEVRLLQAGARSAYPLFIQGRRHPACIAADRAWLLEFVLGDVRRPSPQTARQRLDVHAIDHARGIRTLLGSLELHAPTPGRPIGAVVDVAHGALPQGSYALECCVETDGHRVAMLRLPLLEVCRSFDATGRRLADSDAYATGKRCGTRASIAAS